MFFFIFLISIAVSPWKNFKSGWKKNKHIFQGAFRLLRPKVEKWFLFVTSEILGLFSFKCNLFLTFVFRLCRDVIVKEHSMLDVEKFLNLITRELIFTVTWVNERRKRRFSFPLKRFDALILLWLYVIFDVLVYIFFFVTKVILNIFCLPTKQWNKQDVRTNVVNFV